MPVPPFFALSLNFTTLDSTRPPGIQTGPHHGLIPHPRPSTTPSLSPSPCSCLHTPLIPSFLRVASPLTHVHLPSLPSSSFTSQSSPIDPSPALLGDVVSLRFSTTLRSCRAFNPFNLSSPRESVRFRAAKGDKCRLTTDCCLQLPQALYLTTQRRYGRRFNDIVCFC